MSITKSFHLKLILIVLGLTFILCHNSTAENLSQISADSLAESSANATKLSFDKIWGYIVSLLGPGVALLAVLMARPFVKKKLIESHVTQRIEQIYKSNSQVRLYCQKLISQYTPLIYKHDKLKHQDIKNLSKALEKGYLLTQDSSSEVASLMYFLNNTIQEFERKFTYYDKTFNVFTSDILPFVMNCLHRVVMYSTQAVPVPITTEIKNVNLIVKPLSKFVTDGKISKFKNFKLGVNYDVDSASRLIYLDMVNHTNLPYLMECVSLITETTSSIGKLLLIRKIYAPLNWVSKDDSKNGFFRRKLTLVGFVENSNISMDTKESTETVVLYYSNLTSMSHRPKLTGTSFINDFMDDWLKIDNYEFPEPLKFSYKTDEMIRVEFDRKTLQKTFKDHKRKISKNLKIKPPKPLIFDKLSRLIGRN